MYTSLDPTKFYFMHFCYFLPLELEAYFFCLGLAFNSNYAICF